MPPENVFPIQPPSLVATTVEDGVTVVAVAGDIDLVAGPELSTALLAAVEGSDAVLVDLCDCTFMDSSGLAALLAGLRSAKAAGVRLGVASRPGGAPRALFDLALGHSLFASSDDRASGLAALRTPG